MPLPVTDAVSATLHAALDGLSLRQRVVADNIANVDTPGFRARRVQFEDTLREAVTSQSISRGFSPVFSTTDSGEPGGANGNNVDLRTETMTAMQSLFQYQVISRAASDRHSLISTAARTH